MKKPSLFERIARWLDGTPQPSEPYWQSFGDTGLQVHTVTKAEQTRDAYGRRNPRMTYAVYKCNCGTVLTEGPWGGCAVNAVCRTCDINYGCLPGYHGDN